MTDWVPKIGDRVKVISAEMFTERIGTVGSVISVSAYNIRVKFDSDNKWLSFQKNKLALVDTQKQSNEQDFWTDWIKRNPGYDIETMKRLYGEPVRFSMEEPKELIK